MKYPIGIKVYSFCGASELVMDFLMQIKFIVLEVHL